jgi:glucose/arabinose dehydrogenase
VSVPEVLLQPHSASMEMTFYNSGQFPAEYRGDVFAAFHGSWNRSRRTGYKVVRIFFKNDQPTGAYEDFLTLGAARVFPSLVPVHKLEVVGITEAFAI